MLSKSGTVYLYQPKSTKRKTKNSSWLNKIGTALVVISLGGLTGPFIPAIRLESSYYLTQVKAVLASISFTPKVAPSLLPVKAMAKEVNLFTPDGGSIDPINKDFSLIIPKIGVNAPIIPAVNPVDPRQYLEALKTGVAHASTSYFPDESGTVYLFSHSTNYDWFVKDLNAVFYLLKNLDSGDPIVIFYKNQQYTYKLTEKRVINPTEISYLVPLPGAKRLILQTCWPPGSTTERLLIFADLVEAQRESI